MTQTCNMLIVEDDKAVNHILCRYFRLVGYSVRSAYDGATALREAKANPPSVVLLDLMLPDMSGFDVCMELKRDERTSAATILMVTGLADEESRQRGIGCGAAEYIIKPFDPDQLIETVKRYAA